MADVERQRRLIEFASPDLDAGGLAAERLPAIGAGHQPRGEGASLRRVDGYIGVARADGVSLVVEPRQPRKLGRALFQRSHQQAIFDVVAEFVEADFAGRKPYLGRTDQPASIVDQPHHL